MSILSRIFGRSDNPDAPGRLPSSDELVLLTHPGGEPEAQLTKQMLEQAGIRSMIKNRDALSAESGGIGPAWAYELWVLRRNLKRAREIVGDDASERPDA